MKVALGTWFTKGSHDLQPGIADDVIDCPSPSPALGLGIIVTTIINYMKSIPIT